MAEFAYQFWNRVDEVRGDTPLSKIAEAIGIKDQSIRAMRSQNRFPKSNVIQSLADYLGTSVEYLMKGETNVSSLITKEMAFVRDNKEARALVRAIMDDPALLYPLSALVNRNTIVNEKEKNA